MLNLIIFGPPGAGKGTQAGLIARKNKLTHLSSGDILRHELKNGRLGTKIKKYQDAGKLVPDDIIVEMMETAVAKNLKGNGFIFDGYPRNSTQAKHLDQFLKNKKIKINSVLNLKLSEAEALKRIILRSKTSGRSDDNIKTIKNRFRIYRAQTAPLLKYYRAQKKIINIDGRPTITEVFKNIVKIIEKS
ncbi:MAG: adenylate kinase [Patescibacteria group bacterium]